MKIIKMPVITEVYAVQDPDATDWWHIHECGSDTLLDQVNAVTEDAALEAARDYAVELVRDTSFTAGPK